MPPALERSLYGRGFEGFCRAFFKHYCSFHVSGDLSPIERPVLICANHSSHLDSVAIMLALNLPFCQCGLLAAQDYFFRKSRGPQLITRAMHLIPVSRRSRPHEFEATVDACRRFLDLGGRALIAYPQGTRANLQEHSPYKRGPAVVALRLKLPILPIFIAGTGNVLPRRSIIPRPGAISIRIGSLITTDATSGQTRMNDRSSKLIQTVESHIRALADVVHSADIERLPQLR